MTSLNPSQGRSPIACLTFGISASIRHQISDSNLNFTEVMEDV